MIVLYHAIMAQRTAEQNVDIPAVGGIGTGGGPSGFLPGQSSSVTAEQIVDNPVRPVRAGDLQGFLRGQGSTAFSEQIPEFPDPGGGREDFQPVQGSAASSSDLPGQAGQGVFRTFPQNQKSATQPPHSRSELPPHSSPWTPAPYDASMVLEEEEEEEEECEEDFEVEYVEYNDRLWGREWVPARQRYCWWLAAADGSQAGHTMYGGRRGSSAAGQGDGAWYDSGYMVCVSAWALVPYCIFYMKGNTDPEVVSVLLSGVSGITLNGEVRTVGPSAVFLVFALGIWTLRYEPLVSGSSCSLFGVLRNAWFDKGYMFCVSRMAFRSIL